jgi:ABC-type branched-subunit amino acid transport system substrate-binding protein
MTARRKRGFGLVLVATVVGLVAAMVMPATGGAAAPRAVTVDKVIKVGGLGYVKNFADAAIGTQARFKRANDTNEVKGYTFQFTELADDASDPTTALSEARRLVSQEGVVAIVPDVSAFTPSDYLTQSQIPWFGPGYDTSYCKNNGYGFSVYGCIIIENPKVIPGTNWVQLKRDLAAKGISKPTAALLSTDGNSGKTAVMGAASAAEGAGFNVVYAKGAFPAPPTVVGDYTPFVQAILTANSGKAPDVFYTTIPATNTLAMVNQLKASGYTGTMMSPYYSPLLLKVLANSYIFVQFAGFESTSPGIKQMEADIAAVKPNTPGSIALAGAYFGADFFIKAVKEALKTNKTLTTAAIQKAAGKMTYAIKDTIGPTSYPKAYNGQFQACSTLLFDDGNAFTISQKFECTNKKYPVLPKFKDA